MKRFFDLSLTSMVFCCLIFTASCKKDEPTPVPTPTPTPANQLCDGISGNSDYLPLAIGYKWTYGRPYNVSGSDEHSEEVIGDTIIDGFNYFQIEVFDAVTNNLRYVKHYRVDSNGDVYEKKSGLEKLLVPGNPVVGDIVYGTTEVASINASVKVGDCTYDGCLKLLTPGFFDIYHYYKPGLGMVSSSDYIIEEVKF